MDVHVWGRCERYALRNFWQKLKEMPFSSHEPPKMWASILSIGRRGLRNEYWEETIWE
jgi:hypothetical protein